MEFHDYSSFVTSAYLIAFGILTVFALATYRVFRKNEKLLKKIKSEKEAKN